VESLAPRVGSRFLDTVPAASFPAVSEATEHWRRCSACKRWIPFGAAYQVCSVSTCNRERTGLVFCSVECWEVHLPSANHREAWAVERRAPASAAPAQAAQAAARASEAASGRRVLVRSAAPAAAPKLPDEVLVIASRLKDYVRARSGFNTSDRVLEPLSEIVRRVCDEAIRNAAREGRKTVLDRDVPKS
jgi:predicted amidophosphoribosyltransferase